MSVGLFRLQGYDAPLDNGLSARGRGRPASASHSPQASPPARQRGRPPKNKNKHKRPASDLVPKTSPANKRLRKASPDPLRLNGVCAGEVPIDSVSRTPKVKTTRELLQSIQKESSLDLLRSKTLSSLGVTEPGDGPAPSTAGPRLADKFLAAKRAARAPARPRTPPSPAGSEIVDVEKLSGCEESPVKPELPTEVKKPETVDEILERLPPVDFDAIRWSDEEICDDDDEEPEPKPVTAVDVHKLLESHVEGLNGNRTDGVCPHVGDAPHGLRVSLPATYGATEPSCPEDCLFREWHETLSRTSYQGELLHILPYVIID